MKKSAIITSIIEPTNLKYKQMPTQERLQQTVFTVSSLISQIRDIEIYLIDASLNDFSKIFVSCYPNVNYIHLNSIDSRLANIALTSSKSRGECLLIRKAIDLFPQILESDFLIKASGRYFFENLISDYFGPSNFNKYMFVRREADKRNWIDDNGYDYSKLKNVAFPSDFRNVLTSILYAVGRDELHLYYDILGKCIDKIDKECFYYDIENLLYYFLAQHDFEGRIVATDWVIRGWNGENYEYMNL